VQGLCSLKILKKVQKAQNPKWNGLSSQFFELLPKNCFYLCKIYHFLKDLYIWRVNMKKVLFFTVLILLLTSTAYAQKVFSVQYENQADVKVFVVNYENQADLKVYKVKYENQAGQNDGKWFFTQYANQAKKKIFFVKYENQADVKIYFVKYENQAGWKNNSKKHFFF